ncbi:MAG TPA: YhjD/YihY/BrkB family envelope integrity protein [Syntrophales bacterium]|nr:YhjD/YihY/BrkB family envelope integrity protein [Syntrophales bacterium]HOL59295.1 YhjD/YihY/BrkB family envelope integrity protein [Syntrophales bacterium]HPO35512.1 YhjD/YihY/BrkB family envelope integrity protein [Syntrophales bacterium]
MGNAIANFRENGQTNQAAAISLYAILSLIPFIILTTSIAGYIFGAHPEIKIQLIKAIQYMNPTAASTLMDHMGTLEENQKVFGGLGLITLLWFSSMVFGAVETAFNIVFRVQKPRSYLVSKALAISMIPLAWVVGTASFALSSLSAIFNFPSFSFLKSGFTRFVIPYTINVLFSTLLYKIIPAVRIPWKLSLMVAVVFATLVEPTKYLFPWYVNHYAKYNLIYGSLGTLIILIFWIFYLSLIFLFCAEMMASYLRRDLILLEKMFSRTARNRVILDERVVKKFGRFFPQGTYVFMEGDSGQEMYYVIAGRVQMEKKSGPGKKVLGEMGPAQYFGEMAALIDAPRTASAFTLEDCTLAVIDRPTFRELLKKSESVSLLMLQEFSRRLKYTSEALEQSSRLTLTLFTFLYLVRQGGKDLLVSEVARDIASATGREEKEIETLLTELAHEAILIKDGKRLVSFNQDLAWAFIKWKKGA